MVRIDCLLFGYRKMSVSTENAAAASGLLLRAGICTDVDSLGNFVIRERDYLTVCSALRGRGIEFSSSECMGLRGYIRLSKKHVGVLIALVFSMLLNAFLSSLVWDVRVSGNTLLSDEEVIDALSESGLEVGTLWWGKDVSAVEVNALGRLRDAAWISVNRRGTVAYVEVIERQGENRPIPPVGYSNLVATRDCVIEEITVKSGVAVVKPGDSVRAGELLISGVLPAEGGGGYCYASGVVKGVVTDTVEVTVPASEEQVEYVTLGLDEMRLNIFGFSLKIFKKYGNAPSDCDIIENEKVYALFGNKLPFSVDRMYRASRKTTLTEYTSDEMAALATVRMADALDERLLSADLQKIRTDGGFTDDGYRMTSYLVLTEDVGRDAPFSVDEK